ncbi:ABC transporter permease [Cellulomonas sp. RIT-PI-Y]|uniref:ABC transporter permease n=1 Tax=Cellulomonas sp. RIT-PI-Y TaxID=3035297 RepID=UPI0021DA90AC|nr:ABC transporter permease [Cellulomonas sp. RIT-PI-Y]
MATSVTTRASGAPSAPDTSVTARPSWFRNAAPTLIFLARRLLSSAVVLLAATFVVYLLLAYALDPLEDLRTSTQLNKEALIEARTRQLDLDTPPVIRYFKWLGALLTGDMGVAFRSGQSVTSMLGNALPNTVQLVALSTVIAIGLGVLVGIVSALRQYTRFDYSVTFLSFVLYSLPSFWVAVLLKLWGAIGFNDFLADPSIPPVVMVVVTLASGVIWSSIIGGSTRTRWISFAASAVATVAVLFFLSETDWLLDPGLGIGGVLVIGVGIAFAVVALSAGVQNRRVLYASLVMVAIGGALYYPLQYAFVHASWLLMLGLLITVAVVGVVVAKLFGGWEVSQTARAAIITGIGVGALIFIDRVMQVWLAYTNASQINHRPIATIGSQTPGLSGDFWVTSLDTYTHLLLPTIALILISFASYTRYSRASLLEVMNQDYIRTARAKGLPERVVTMRHAFRNALIPLATVIPLDIASLFGGAIITERVFAIPGMGTMFIKALNERDPDPIMGYFLVTGALLVIASIAVDFIYAALDPRIRVNS